MVLLGAYYKMNYDVVVYVSSVANAFKHPRKVACLESFAQGCKLLGLSVLVEKRNRVWPCRLAVILGWATAQSQGGANVALRKQIIVNQRTAGMHTMCIDASCFKYLDNHSKYLRYSIGGPFYDQANYANTNSSDEHWKLISKDLLVSLAPNQINPDGHIVICMQRDGGFAMKNLDPMQWLNQKIQQIRDITGKHIVIRPHPGSFNIKDFDQYQNIKKISVINPLKTKLTDNLVNAYCAVFFNSSASVAAVCAGIPIFVDDQSCVSWKVANHDLSMLNQPKMFDRTQWIHDLAACHWTDEDGQSGRIYQKFLPFL